MAGTSSKKVKLTPPGLKISPTAEYVTSGGAELRLDKNESGLWYTYFYRGGELPRSLQGVFLTRSDLRRAIIHYLKSDNVLGKARWVE